MIKNIKISRLHLMLLPLIGLSIIFLGCEGPEGPPGADGTAGTDGLPGLDINESCKVCHNSGEELIGRRAQYDVSGHATGGHAAYGNRSSCARCHTSQGFVEFVAGAEITAPYTTPNQQNCRTCHDLHNTYTEDDWARRVTAPVVSIQSDTLETTFADFGEGNICATCHQARHADIPTLTASADVTITSKRFGPHHGPQANMLDGSAGYQVAGTVAYTAHAHSSISDGCVTCHMAEGGNYVVGGHTWNMYEDPHDADGDGDLGHFSDKSCVASCHAGVDMEDKIAASKATTDALIADLKVLLDAGGYLDSEGYVANSGVSLGGGVTLTVAPKIAGAIYNYRLIALEDGGYVVHNPTLVKALLTNSIEALASQ
ncbi:MAG: hypothetical protein IIA60_01235 [Candidatus Marinimicrobia bacterium]|nr:hypothetical protein [Candidatus Neomarinimicrobiota bacterium]